MNTEVVEQLEKQGFTKEFSDPEMEPGAFYMRRNFGHQYLTGLHLIVTQEGTLELWADDMTMAPIAFNQVRLHKAKFSEGALARMLLWIEK